MRKSWDEFFMDMAQLYSTRSTCLRRHCGCIFVRDKRVVACGFNGASSGLPHCTEVGCLLEEGHCVRCLHSETSAIGYAAKNGVSLDLCTIYIAGGTPCIRCALSLVSVGVKSIFVDSFYPDVNTFGLLKAKNIPVYGLFKEEPTDPMVEYLEGYKIIGALEK